jgi:uncharacterized protein
MKVLVTGATGFVGTKLVHELMREGHSVVVLSRNGEKAKAKLAAPVTAYSWNPSEACPPAAALEGVQAVFHLAGEGIAEKRWSKEQKRRIYDSRVLGTRHLAEAIAAMEGPKPSALICASAIGFYGDRGDETLTETSALGTGFQPKVCGDWEKEAQALSRSGVRVVLLRIGVVLGREGGMLKRVLPIFKTGLAGPLGNGRQYLSWIHADDLVGILLHSLKDPALNGPLNAVAPGVATNAEFSRELGKALGRPAFLPAPALVLKLALGEMSELLLGSQRVQPEKAIRSGYTFKFPTLPAALADLVPA